jgi:streptogramin lyase
MLHRALSIPQIMFFSPSKARILIPVILFALPVFSNCLSVHGASSDAIGVRVVSNIEHYSASRWYKSNITRQGSPLSINIDGYDGVRDGRTAYVNAANVVNGVLYTNIYIISFNQGPEKATQDIFGKILQNWKFNANYREYGFCEKNPSVSCVLESDCEEKDFCASDKSKITRDTKRLEGIAELKILLADHKSSKGRYPVLSAGTYLPNSSISTWPSWIERLGVEIGKSLPIDPVNRLGECPGYDPVTCWNEKEKRFADPDLANSILDPPANSRVFIYTTNSAGSFYRFCSFMESGYVTGGNCVQEGGDISPNSLPTATADLPWAFWDSPYDATVTVSDADGDRVNWSADIPIDKWERSGWSNVSFTIAGNIGTLHADNVGQSGNQYVFYVNMTDGKEKVTKKFSFSSSVNLPPIITLNCEAAIRIGNSYTCNANIESTDDGISQIRYTGFPAGLTDNGSGLLTGTPSATGNYSITLTATDQHNAVATANFSLSVNNYCGDSTIQNPNLEGVAEECDDGNSDVNDVCDSVCKFTYKPITVTLGDGFGDGMVYDNNQATTSANHVINGTYLKLSRVISTPYIWIANTNIDKISKIRTFDGCKRDCRINVDGSRECWWDCSVWETRGQIIGIYPVGYSPSRTAVNAETGDVWVGNRGTTTLEVEGSVTKLDINGNELKTCRTGINSPRGIVIDEFGDVWVANSRIGEVVKLTGDDHSCDILETVNVGGLPYGLALDSNFNIWVANKGFTNPIGLSVASDSIQKINPIDLSVSNYGPAGGVYGIAVDAQGDVWAGCMSTPSMWRLPRGAANTVSIPMPAGNHTTSGVTADLYGNMWTSAYYARQVIKIDPTSMTTTIAPSAADFPHGIGGDSVGQVWSISTVYNKARVFSQNMTVLGDYDVNNENPTTIPYTYSDMTGLNRAMVLRPGIWTSDTFDSGYDNQHWGSITWQQYIPPEITSANVILVQVKASNLPDLTDVPWQDAASWNALPFISPLRSGRYVKVRVEMHSNRVSLTPVVWDLSFSYP